MLRVSPYAPTDHRVSLGGGWRRQPATRAAALTDRRCALSERNDSRQYSAFATLVVVRDYRNSAGPNVLVWDGGPCRQATRAGSGADAAAHAFRSVLGPKVPICKPADPQARACWNGVTITPCEGPGFAGWPPEEAVLDLVLDPSDTACLRRQIDAPCR